jgi:hypothetical protein
MQVLTSARRAALSGELRLIQPLVGQRSMQCSNVTQLFATWSIDASCAATNCCIFDDSFALARSRATPPEDKLFKFGLILHYRAKVGQARTGKSCPAFVPQAGLRMQEPVTYGYLGVLGTSDASKLSLQPLALQNLSLPQLSRSMMPLIGVRRALLGARPEVSTTRQRLLQLCQAAILPACMHIAGPTAKTSFLYVVDILIPAALSANEVVVGYDCCFTQQTAILCCIMATSTVSTCCSR